MTNIAVYGTLREGFGNHRVLGDCRENKVGLGWTVDQYEMTASGIPFVDQNTPTSRIRVEIYAVTDEQLPTVDQLEGYNPANHEGSWYKRTPIQVEMDNGETIEASIYFNNDKANTVVESGDFADYKRQPAWS